ncbi:hypothetical protein [Nonomuraea rhodomycinica]|uniref:hypothetical protein n=1 Tax=Nonomuraea rhodomycinica TaxID=1712872 RepID=UPI001C37AC39|nr:hypothetical protein [Nonomuraea rhodomycinica]
MTRRHGDAAASGGVVFRAAGTVALPRSRSAASDGEPGSAVWGTLIVGGVLQTVFAAALLGLGADPSWMWLMVVAGLATMTQQVGITMGTPIMSAVVTAAMAGTGASAILGGLKVAIGVNAAIVLLGVLTSALFLRGARTSAR